ncbi:hypothetical protein [Shinella sp.]|uniref:hypothetical protein n=1 Tax=Shinella sp. TaxID=1870904 RepID=UPI0029A7E8F9|nr:hypothetical protein [Shinella sp.]MDX3973162.1 hypothetical protein [Shinella sp.]
MNFREGTPTAIVIEMYAVVFWLPAVALLIVVAAFVFLIRSQGKPHYRARLFVGLSVLCLAVPLIWIGGAYGALTLLDHPRYGRYVECEPCF